MGKGGGGSATQTQIQDVPDWAKPDYQRLLQATRESIFDISKGADGVEQVSFKPYEAYGGQRLAGTPQDITTSQEMIRGVAGSPIPGVGQAMGIVGGLGQQAGRLGRQMPGQFAEAGFQQTGVSPYAGFQQAVVSPYSGFQAFQPTQFGQFQERAGREFEFEPARQFTGQEVSSYMSPYMEQVVQRQQEDARLQFERGQAGRAAQAVQAGAFGGSRQAVQEALAEEALGRQLGDIRATGLQSSYEQAARQFEADRAAQMGIQQQRAAEAARVQGMGVGEAARVQTARAAELARIQGMTAEELARLQQSQAAELARVQGISVDEAARLQQSQAAELARTQGITVDEAARVQAARASEAARVQAARADEAMRQREFQLQTMGFSADMAGQLANLGERARAGDIQAAQLLEAQGLGAMAREQAERDIAYQDFLRQQEYPFEQLGRYSTMLRGLPVQGAGTTTTYQPQASPFQQALGAGLSMASLYRAFQ